MSSSDSEDSILIPTYRMMKRPRFEERELIVDVDYKIYGELALEEGKKKGEEEFDIIDKERPVDNIENRTFQRTKKKKEETGIMFSSRVNKPRCKTRNSSNTDIPERNDLSNSISTVEVSPAVREPTPPLDANLYRAGAAEHTPNARAARRGRRAAGGARGRRGRGRGRQSNVEPPSTPVLVSDEDDPNAVVLVTSPCHSAKRSKLVKIMSLKGAVQRFPMKQHDSFDNAIATLAAEAGVEQARVQLYSGDRRVHAYDTPLSAELTVADILEMHLVRERTTSEAESDASVSDGDVIKIQVQSSIHRARANFQILRSDPLDRLIRLYCKKFSLDNTAAEISFDGENVQKWKTPEDLDMEEEDCIDIRFK